MKPGRLFAVVMACGAAAGEQRQLLREDLALQTAEDVADTLSTRRLVTSELSGGARFAELASWPQHERDLAAETIYRFVFRSLYEVRAFNGDPHPV
jgi:predicted unusual protein kinase regulating ubiquinone biosynthesis (AarF/ABC1/UbiB family)